MNRLCYRVIFNRVRGVFMAVREHTKCRAPGASGGVGPALLYAVAAAVAVACAMLCADIAFAQVVADPGAPRGQQATVLAAPNGVPVVNIRAPSAAGVSHNTYRQFDVNAPGAILNNSRGNVQTRLGGWVQGNPWLAQGSARVILNEVNSTHPSLLRGPLEVAGPRTEVIVTNPAGISIDGGSFINTSRITLTTGAPVMNGGNLESYRVQRGTVAIDGRGLDATGTDSATILARAIQVNAGIWANDLRVVAGAHETSADGALTTPIAGTGPAPAFLLDVAEIGGMYAGHIFLVGTEAGLGVRNAGNITASGALTLSADGWLTNSGTLQAGAGSNIQVARLDNSGGIGAKDLLQVASRGDITNTGGTMEAGSLRLSSAAGDIDNRRGTLRQTSAASLDLRASGITNTQGGRIGTAPILAPATVLPLEPAGTGGTAAPAPVSPPVTPVTPAVIAPIPGTVTAAGTLHNDAGRIETGGPIAVSAGTLDNSGGSLHAARVAVTGPAFSNVAGTLTATDRFTAQVGRVDNSDGSLQTAHLAIASSGAVVNQGGSLVSSGMATLTAGGAMDNRGGTLSSGSDLSVRAATLDNTGNIRAANDLRVDLSGHLNNQAQASLTAGRHLAVTAGSLDSGAAATIGAGVLADGKPAATGELQIDTTGALAAHGLTTAVGRLALSGSRIDLDGSKTHAAEIGLVTTQGDLSTRNATIGSAGALQIDSRGALDNSGGVLAARGDVTLQSAALVNRDGTIATIATIGPGGAIRIHAAALDNDAGLIQAAGAVTIDTHGQALANTRAAAHTAGPGGIVAGTTLDIGSGALDNSAGFIASQGDAQLVTTGFDNRSGQLQSAGDLSLQTAETGSLDNRAGLIRSAGTASVLAGAVVNSATLGADRGIEAAKVRITTGELDNRSGAIRAVTDAALHVSGSFQNRGGAVQADRDLQITADRFDGEGRFAAGRDVSIAAVGDITNRADITAAQDLRYTTEGRFTNHALLHAGRDLTLGGRDIDNQAAAEISAGKVAAITATATLTNRGLIDGADTRITAGTLQNTGTGRIYGDRIAVTAGTLDNSAETLAGTTRAGTIAARQRLDIAANRVTNRDGALIFSAGDLAIGGTLDASRHATGRAAVVTNSAADIEALGKLAIAAGQLDNLNVGFATHESSSTEAVAARYIHLDLNLQGPRYTVDELGRCRACDSDHEDPGYSKLVRYEYVAPSTQYPFEAGYARHPYLADGEYDNGRPAIATDGETIPNTLERKFYAADDPVWRLFDVPFGHSFELNQKLYAYNLDFMERAHRDFTTVEVSQRSVTETVVDTPGVAGRIRSGGDMALDIGSARNVNSQVVAGGALAITGGSVENVATEGRRVVVDTGTWHKDSVAYGHYELRQGFYGWGSYAATVEDRSTTLSTGAIQQYAAAHVAPLPGAGSSAQADYTALAKMSAVPDGERAGTPPAVTAPLLGQGAQIRTATADLRLPTASLFRTHPESGSRYLIETDPRFADYRQWLSSDYLLDALGIDPAGTTKRLGDGFYEQQLVRQQVTQLTGQRQLAGYTNDDAQYAALLSGAVTFAQALQLRPGIALNPEQIARLTSDIVWLVTRTVTLPDGTTSEVLVPQLYVHVQPGDLNGQGSLLAGRSVNLQLDGDVTNIGGTIAGRDVVRITADNIRNLGGRITGNAVALQAVTDIDNLGGTIDAAQTLVANAGRDLNVRSTTSTNDITAGASAFSRTGVDRVAGLYLTGAANGVLVASARRDLNLIAGVIANASAGGATVVSAAHDVNLGTVQTGSSAVLADGRNASRESSAQEVGSRIQASGNVALVAGNDVNIRAATVDAGGALQVQAARDVNIEAGSASTHLDQSHTGTGSGFLSSSSQTRKDRVDTTTAIGSSLGGDTVAISAGRDLSVRGSNLVSDTGTVLVAGRDVNIVAATDTRDESHSERSIKTGLMGSGGAGVTAGTFESRTTSDTVATTAVGSTVGSIKGNVTVVAGNRYTQTGSDVVAPAGDIRIVAKDVAITEAREVTDSRTSQTTRQAGITLAVTSPALAAIQSTVATTEAIGNTGSGRMKALGVASALMNADTALGNLASEDPAKSGANVSLSVGSSQSTSTTTAHSDTAKGSKVSGQNVSIVATGGGQDSNILVRGSDITGSKTVVLAADNQVNILAAQSTSEQHSQNSSSSASVGVSFGSDGLMFTASASGARGRADGSDVTQVNSHVTGTDRVGIQSGGDTTIRGAVVKGNRVVADVGGNLNVESLQDTARFDSKQQSLGGSVSLGYGKSGGSLSISQNMVDADYASVGEQSGIQAGDGGFDVKVKGKTDLVGGVIASTQKAIDEGKTRFDTASLTTRDIQNQDNFNASGLSLSGGYGNLSQGATSNRAAGVEGSAVGFGSVSGRNSGATTSGVSGIAGNTEVRTGDGSGGLARTFDADKAARDVAAQMQITSTFGQQAAKAGGEYANGKAAELRSQGNEAEASKWDEGGTYRIAMHSVLAGLTGGIQGALGAASSQLAIDSIGKEIARTDLPLGVKTALVAAAGTAIGMAVGGEAGAAAGFNATANNYLSSTDLRNRRQAVADCNGSSSCVLAIQRVSQETTLANNARVLDACQGSGGDCGSAIGKAQQDRADLQAYRQGLVAEQGESTDVANRNAIAVQIVQTDAQIHSADTAIADGKLIQAGGNYSLAGLTAEERMAIGFALDPIAPAGIRAGGGLVSRLGNTGELSQSTSRIRTPDGGFIELPPQGSLSSVAVRQWYLEQEAKIPNLINGSVPLEQQALQAWSLRNAFRNAARSAMHDQDAAKMLNQTAPNLTWNQVVDKYSSKHSGDDLWRQIIGASQRSNQSVNDSLGIILPRK